MWKVPVQYTEKRDVPKSTRPWDLLSGSQEPEAVYALLPLKLCCFQALSCDTITARGFNVRVPLDHLIPDILMTDLPEELKIDLSQFEFDPDDPAKLLGVGSAGKDGAILNPLYRRLLTVLMSTQAKCSKGGTGGPLWQSKG